MPRPKSPRRCVRRGCWEMMRWPRHGSLPTRPWSPVLDPGRGRTKQGYFWAMARGDRPWGGSEPPAVVYSYAPGRGQIHANTLLGGYRTGILQCDGYQAYKKLAGPTRRPKLPQHGLFAGATCAGVLRSGQDQRRRSPWRRCGALPRCMRSRRVSVARAPLISLAVRVKPESKPLVTELRFWFEAQIAKLPARSPTAEGDPVCTARPLGWAGAIPRRRTHRTR